MYAITATSLREQSEHSQRCFKKQVLAHIVEQAKMGFTSAKVKCEYMTPEVVEDLAARGFTIGPVLFCIQEVSWK